MLSAKRKIVNFTGGNVLEGCNADRVWAELSLLFVI